jgi:hypothetical protein
MKQEMLDSMVNDAKAELDALEDAFAKKSAANGKLTARSGIRAGLDKTPPVQPLYGVHPPPPQPLYGVHPPPPQPLYGVHPPTS